MSKKLDIQNFFYLEPIRFDEYGLTPEFQVDGKNPFYDKPGQYLDKDFYITDLNEQLTLVNGSLQEGKARLLEIPRFGTFAFHPVLLVSENVKTILQQFNLPKHRFDLVILQQKKIKTNSKFYLFQLDSDSLTRDLVFSKVQFLFRIEDSFAKTGITKWKKIETPITNYEDLGQTIDALKKKHNNMESLHFVNHRPNEFILKSNYDIYSYSNRKIVVSEFLKNELESLLPDQMEFHSANKLKIKMEEDSYYSLSKRKFNIESQIIPVTYKNSSKDNFFYAKNERLEKSKIEVPEHLHENDLFAATEKALKIIFPEKIKKYYIKGIAGKEYEFLPVLSFYKQYEYADRQPETFGAIIFAENGSGDSLGLILEEKSDFVLHSQIYEFLHETGEVVKFSKTKL